MTPLPISLAQAKEAHDWLINNFDDNILSAIKGTKYTPELICAIACQESAYRWLSWIKDYEPSEILALCCLDYSGDITSAPRSAFPKNTDAFREKYGDEFTDMLINESNNYRAAEGWSDSNMVAKGWGIFQYDLQNVLTDEIFFRSKLWYNIDDCLNRLIGELNSKAAVYNDLASIIKAYNGAGEAAQAYSENVMAYAASFV